MYGAEYICTHTAESSDGRTPPAGDCGSEHWHPSSRCLTPSTDTTQHVAYLCAWPGVAELNLVCYGRHYGVIRGKNAFVAWEDGARDVPFGAGATIMEAIDAACDAARAVYVERWMRGTSDSVVADDAAMFRVTHVGARFVHGDFGPAGIRGDESNESERGDGDSDHAASVRTNDRKDESR